MKVALVCYEKPSAWILGKLALRLRDELILLGVDARVCDSAWPEADINHHVIYSGIKGDPLPRSTAMVTHVDTLAKVELLRRQLAGNLAMGICLSADTAHKLTALGLPAERLCAINYPSPQAGHIAPRRIHVAVTSRVYEHGSKREYLLGELARHLPAGAFTFHIMGSGWEPVVHELRSRGTEVVYHQHFNARRYRQLWEQIDYYLYLGQDEGSTGLLDALEAGVQTIATPQGFHLDLDGGITHAITDFADIKRVFTTLAQQRAKLRESAAAWTWNRYAREHIDVWTRLLEGAAFDSGRAGTHLPKQRLLPAMPTAPGPGGAVHRPRLLVVASGELQPVVALWTSLGPHIPHMQAVIVRGVGEEVDLELLRASPLLEVRVADLLSWSPQDLATLSLDFDCVVFWNCLSPPHLASLLARRKPNYLMRSSVMGRIASLIVAVKPLDRLLGSRLFGWTRQLQDESKAKVVAFATSQRAHAMLREGVSEKDWKHWWASVCLLVHGDDIEPGELIPTGSSTPAAAIPAELHDGSSVPDPRWQPALDKLFEVMAIPHDPEHPSPPLLALRKVQSAVLRRRR